MLKRFCHSIVPRAVRSAERDLKRCLDLYCEGNSPVKIRAIESVARKSDCEEYSSRASAIATTMCLKSGDLEGASRNLEKVVTSPSILLKSLQILLLSQQNKIDEALDVIESSLNQDNFIFNSLNESICDEALDSLCSRIKEGENTQNQMRRFRRLQKTLTSFELRSSMSVDQMLRHPINRQFCYDDRSTDVTISQRVVSEIPHFLGNNNSN